MPVSRPRVAPALLAALLLAGCIPVILPVPISRAPVTWTLQESAGGARLTAADPAGPIVQMTCTEPGAPFTVRAFRLTPAGQQTLAFGTDRQTYRFPVVATAAGPGVTASGALPYDLVTSFLSDGAIYGKADDLHAHEQRWLRLTRLEPSEERVLRLGDIAVVSVRMEMEESFRDTPIAGPYRYTRVWCRRANGWRIVAGHVSAVS